MACVSLFAATKCQVTLQLFFFIIYRDKVCRALPKLTWTGSRFRDCFYCPEPCADRPESHHGVLQLCASQHHPQQPRHGHRPSWHEGGCSHRHKSPPHTTTTTTHIHTHTHTHTFFLFFFFFLGGGVGQRCTLNCERPFQRCTLNSVCYFQMCNYTGMWVLCSKIDASLSTSFPFFVSVCSVQRGTVSCERCVQRCIIKLWVLCSKIDASLSTSFPFFVGVCSVQRGFVSCECCIQRFTLNCECSVQIRTLNCERSFERCTVNF